MKKLLPTNLDLALLLIRIGLGFGFLAHGIQKLQGIDGVIGFFGKLGLPSFMAYVVALTETLGGLAMILGLWTECAGLALAAIMVGAISLTKVQGLPTKGYIGMELDAMYLLTSLALVFSGPGKYSVEKCQMGKSDCLEEKKA